MILTENTLAGIGLGLVGLAIQAVAVSVILSESSVINEQNEFLTQILARNLTRIAEEDAELLRNLRVPIMQIEG